MIEINGKSYKAKEFDFNAICAMGDSGADISSEKVGSFSFMRAYLAYCMDMTAEDAGKELNEHIVKGGSLKDIAEILKDKVEQSGFFQALAQAAKAENSAVEE